MSSATSTNLQPWQFFTLAALGCATAVSFIARGQGATVIILLSILIATAGLVGYATLRAVRPLVSPEDDRAVTIGQRTRVALEREKLLTLRSIKELEFDRAMGRLSEDDFKEMSGRLRTRAAGLITQLDAGVGYREQIERDLAKRLGDARLKPSRSSDGVKSTDGVNSTDSDERSAPAFAEGFGASTVARSASEGGTALAERVCANCHTANDSDARFCKACGQAISAR